MALLENTKVFIITYDDGEKGQTLSVPHYEFEKFDDLRNNILIMKCLKCNFESHFEENKK